VGSFDCLSFLTDYGLDDGFVAACHGVAARIAPGIRIIDITHLVPPGDVRRGAAVLAQTIPYLPHGVHVAVVDPGVGTTRRGIAVQGADGSVLVGPDNGLLSVVDARAVRRRTWRIVWRPQAMSASFHGRDLFAPVAASIATGVLPANQLEEIAALNVQLGPDDLPEVIYIDHYGSALTGLRAGALARTATVTVRGHRLSYACVFADAPKGSAFWYENSIGLVEIAANRAGAAGLLGIGVADPVTIVT